MWVLLFYIMLSVGGPEQAYYLTDSDGNRLEFVKEEECIEERNHLWRLMDEAYPFKEQELYRFSCVKHPRRIVNLHEDEPEQPEDKQKYPPFPED